MATIDQTKRIQLTKDGDGYTVYNFGQPVGRVFPVESGGREMWNFENNPYPSALFHRPYRAAKKMVDRRNRRSAVADLNGKPLAVQAA